jgi:WD40 repeat protein
VLKTDTGEAVPGWDEIKNLVTGIAFSPDGKMLTIVFASGQCEIYDVATARRQVRLDGQAMPVTCFSPDGKTVAMSYYWRDTAPVRLHDAENGMELVRLERERSPIAVMAFTPDGKTIAAADWIGKINVWDIGKFAR